MKNRKEEIKKKGFRMDVHGTSLSEQVVPANNFTPVDFSKIKIGTKRISDAVLTLSNYEKVDKRFTEKDFILKAISDNHKEDMREISNFYFKASGIYSRLCRYMAYLYRYDWMVTPYINDKVVSEKDLDTVLADFYKILLYLDNSDLKALFGEIALKVIRNGCYYGYLIPSQDRVIIQELPVNYCRTRFTVKGRPAIEFNMRYFDEMFKDTTQRMQMLKLFPAEFKKGYRLYKDGKLPPQFSGDSAG